MDNEKDIYKSLDNPELKKNPFSVPDGYFLSLESAVQEKIHKPRSVFGNILYHSKASITLAFSFLLILGVGYGILSLTPLLDKSGSDIENADTFTALIEAGYIDNNFIDYLYDEIDIKIENTDFVMSAEDIEDIENSLSEKDLFEYLEIEFPDDK